MLLASLNFLAETPALSYTFVALLGLCIGSFLNVVISRTPKILQQEWQNECQLLLHPDHAVIDENKLTLSTPASTCPKCQHVIAWYQNIPVLSWLYLKGKCGHCQNPISVRYPLIELLSMFCSIIVLMVLGPTLQMLLGLVLTWTLIALTFIDFDTQLLPDRFTLPLAALGLAANSYHVYVSASAAIWGYVLGFLCLWIVYYLFKLITGKEGMGYGDFKLLGALGAWMGAMLLPLIVLMSSLIGVVVGLFLLKRNGQNQAFAFGPYIAIAGWVAFLWGDKIMAAYLGG